MKFACLSRLTFALLLIPACHLAAGADKPPSAESFFKNPVTRSATLSPQGHYVALVTRMADGKQVLAVRDTSDLKSVTVPVTTPDDNKIIALHWINEQRIGFTLKNYRIEFKSNLDEYAVDRNGSNLVHLISGNWTHNQIARLRHEGQTLTADYASSTSSTTARTTSWSKNTCGTRPIRIRRSRSCTGSTPAPTA